MWVCKHCGSKNIGYFWEVVQSYISKIDTRSKELKINKKKDKYNLPEETSVDNNIECLDCGENAEYLEELCDWVENKKEGIK